MSYDLSTPIVENIEKVNNLYDEGNTIVMWTARGTLSNKNFSINLFTINKIWCEIS